MAPTEAEMREAFNVCDVDGKGTISVSEMAAVLKALDKDVSLAEVSFTRFSFRFFFLLFFF